MLTRKGRIIKVRFDGKVMIPLEPVDLQQDFLYEVRVMDPLADGGSTLQKLAELAKAFPPNPDSPGDASMQHDHYLYGTPKRPNP
jgi:hypothetical protein